MAGLGERVSQRSRQRKLRLFMDEVRPTASTRVLDVGVDDGGYGMAPFATTNFFEEFYPYRGQVTAVGDHLGTRFAERYPGVAYVHADACALPFADDSFDAVFSNAVIEHVGDRERQRRFVAEVVRVAPISIVTTPNRWFPIELHTKLPLVHWLPPARAEAAFRRLNRQAGHGLRLLGPRALRGLYPERVDVRVVIRGMTLVAIARR